MNPSYQALIEAASDGFLSPAEIERFAPDTPSPDDVECYVDVETVSKQFNYIYFLYYFVSFITNKSS